MDRLPVLQQRIQERIGASRFRTWFGDSTQLVLTSDGLAVMVNNSFVGDWIVNNYMAELVAATREVLGGECDPQVRVAQVDVETAAGGAASAVLTNGRSTVEASVASRHAALPPAQPHRRSGPTVNTRHDLDSFVVGPSNQLAMAAARNVVQSPGKSFRLLVLHGGCGLGKTHLLHAVCNGVRTRHPLLEWRYVSGEQFTNEYIAAVKAGSIESFRARFRHVDVLVVDDIHFLANKKATQEEFLHTYNAIDTAGKVVVLSSDKHPRSISMLSEPLVNRLVSGMVVNIDPPDFLTRREILRRRAAAAGQLLSDAVIDFLAQSIDKNVRELEGAFLKLTAFASLQKEPITLEFARTVLADDMQRAAAVVDPREIERVVGARFGVTPQQIHSRSRDRTICLARALTMFLVRKHTTLSFPEIGQQIGKKNHSTVLMATQRVDRQLTEDAVVGWKAGGAQHQALIRGLLDELERELRLAK